ncbi:MAG: tRNA (guanine(46)-N(7))-methyltransferase TrmB, partial [Bdellovibrionales bacterium]
MTKERIRKVYGRRQGRPLRGDRQEALDVLYPKLEILPSDLKQDASLPPLSLFRRSVDRIGFEVGFGNGEFLRNNMINNPKTGFIGAEPFVNGVSAFLKSIKDDPHDNVRVFMDDAMSIAKSLADNSVDEMYVLNPDPWHKSRHHKRRIISPQNLDVFSRILKSGATLTMTTDVDELAEWMCRQASNHADFEWTATCADDWRNMPEGWYQTRYELKGKAAGRKQSYL